MVNTNVIYAKTPSVKQNMIITVPIGTELIIRTVIFIKNTVKIKIYFTILFLYAIIHSLNTNYSDQGAGAYGEITYPFLSSALIG